MSCPPAHLPATDSFPMDHESSLDMPHYRVSPIPLGVVNADDDAASQTSDLPSEVLRGQRHGAQNGRTSRFRNRKINFKVRLPIHVGSFDLVYDEAVESQPEGKAADDGVDGGDRAANGVETGVDKEEEGELHLQNAISASAAALLTRSGVSRPISAASSTSHAGDKAAAAAAAAYIPTPDATGIIDNYDTLYPANAFAEPSTYIRFSDTVEDVTGPAYTMDEEDAAFLQQINAQLDPNGSHDAANGGHDNLRALRSPRKDKGKEAARGPLTISEDDFESVMSHFESYTDEQYPTLSTDPDRVPSEAELDASFATVIDPDVGRLRPLGRPLYAHWKERRLKRDGHAIIPQLDYDESREDNPYVCFRRREAKAVRKTRRSETQNLDRLVRLRSDLSSARELLQMVLDRERVKRDVIRDEIAVLEARALLRDLKRKANENDGDDDVLVPKERKKRRRIEEVPAQAIAPMSTQTLAYRAAVRSSGREAARISYTPAAPYCVEPVHAFRDRTQGISSRIERDLERKRAADREWEDYTDGAYLAMPASPPSRFYRTVDGETSDRRVPRPGALTYSGSALQPPSGHRPAFRKRTGRGGRVMLDRLLFKQRPRGGGGDGDDDDDTQHRLDERWRYDADHGSAFHQAQVLDDYALTHTLRRLELMRDGDLAALRNGPAWLEEASGWLYQSDSRRSAAAVNVVGKLPGRPLPGSGNSAFPPALSLQSLAAGINAPPPPRLASPALQNAGMVNHLLLAQAQGQALRTRSSVPPPQGQMSPQALALASGAGGPAAASIRRTPSAAANPLGASNGPISASMPVNSTVAASLQQQWQAAGMNGLGKQHDAAAYNTSSLMAQMLGQQHAATLTNGRPTAQPSPSLAQAGSRMPTTSRLPTPLYSGAAPHAGPQQAATTASRLPRTSNGPHGSPTYSPAAIPRPDSASSAASPASAASSPQRKRNIAGLQLGNLPVQTGFTPL